MTPIEYYYQQCEAHLIIEDAEQLIALKELTRIFNELQLSRTRSRFFSKLKKPAYVKGLYLWGSVGIGKTFLMDCFYLCLPFQEKMRIHFHAFMQFIHQELKQHQGQKNPLKSIAKQLSKKIKLLCFDEFFVSDIADAMILARLLEALFAEGITLVATSNTMPDELYKKGLQRALFLPAIQLLKSHTTVLHVKTHEDYRMRHLKTAGVFFTPHDAQAQLEMETDFGLLSVNQTISHEPLILYDRAIKAQKKAENCIWFDFQDLCSIPRSQEDYLAIAKQFQNVFLSRIPMLTHATRDQIILFIKLIDVLYDSRVRLIFSADVPIDLLSPEGSLSIDFSRTRSRLQEMQSVLYFSKISL